MGGGISFQPGLLTAGVRQVLQDEFVGSEGLFSYAEAGLINPGQQHAKKEKLWCLRTPPSPVNIKYTLITKSWLLLLKCCF